MTPNDVKGEERRVKALRMQMVDSHPFWGHLLLQVRLVPAPGLPTFAATDCVRHLWYNPEHTRHLDNAQLGFVLAHEVGHQLLASGFREGGRDHHLWNCATDYAINRLVDRIQAPGNPVRPMYRMPNKSVPGLGDVKILLDRRFDGMVAEAIYDVLAQESLPDPRPVSVSVMVSTASGEGVAVTLPGLSDHRGGIDVHLPEDALSESEREELRSRVHAAVAAWQRAESAGDCPGDVLREVDARGRPRVPWQRLLQSCAGMAMARDDWTLAKPSLRFLDQGIVVPGPWSERAGHLVVSVDSSGSMTREVMQMVARELKGIVEHAESVTIVVSDAQVQQVVEEGDVEAFLAKVRFRGGGGTDHRPVFELLRERRMTPDLFVGLTDLYTTLPERRPRYPVLWVVPGVHGSAAWGRTVVVNAD